MVVVGAVVVVVGALDVVAAVVCVVDAGAVVDVAEVPQAASARLAIMTTAKRTPSFVLIRNSLFQIFH